MGCVLSLHSHFKGAPDTLVCDFTFVPGPGAVGLANNILLLGQKSDCRLFICLGFFSTRQKMRVLKSMLFHYLINIMIVGMKELY